MFSKTSGYAIRGILFIVSKQKENRNVGIKEIAEQLNIPQHFLGKILQALTRKKIINSTKGPNGGFCKNNNTEGTTVLEIIDEVEGLGFFNECTIGLQKCSDESPCVMHKYLKEHRDKIYDTLSSKTIGQLAQEANDEAHILF